MNKQEEEQTRRLDNPMTTSGISRTTLRRSQSRVVVLMGAFAFLFLFVSVRLVNLTFVERDAPLLNSKIIVGKSSDDLSVLAALNRQTTSTRGNIYDRNGYLLATSLKTSSVYADPKDIMDPVITAKRITETLPSTNYSKILKRLQSDRRFVWIKRNLTPNQVQEINALGLPGIHFLDEEKRIYPNNSITAHSVGYTNIDNIGVMGIEKAFDQLLSHKQQDITLSLDIRIQNAMHRELRNSFKRFKAKGAAGIVIDVKSGEVLSLVSLPDFNPHGAGHSPVNYQFNRATMGVYELGSIFKIFSVAAALEHQNMKPTKVFPTRKPIKRAGHTIRDYHPQKRNLNIAEILVFSSNIGSALIAETLGTDTMRQTFADLRILDPIEFDIEEIGRPLLPYPWRDIHTLTASYGHGIAVSPLQAASAMASTVNGGYYVRPTLMKMSQKQKSKMYKEYIFSPDTSEVVSRILRLAVTDGTGGNADVKGLRVGGKTGTADKASRGEYSEALVSSFAGFFPMEDPQYLVFVVVDEPQGREDTFGYATGGWVAAPVVGNVIKEVASINDVTFKQDKIAKNDRRVFKIKSKGGRRLTSF